jgi:L-rhamnonate dehydratase
MSSYRPKVGRGALHMPLEEGTRRDVAVVRAVREAVGPGARLMIDANNGYNYNLTIRVLHETRDCDIWWIEEAFHEDPVLYTHLRSWLRAEGMKILIADGEGVASPLMLQWALEGAVDCLQFSCREKGFTEWLRLGKLLRDVGRFAAPHNFGSHWTCFAAGHLAAVLGCHVEWDAAERCPALDTSAFGPIRGGRVTLPVDKPGFGIVLNSEALEASPEYWSAE